MTPKEIAAHYEAKVFESPEAAKVAGFVLTETMAPRNVWNKASAAQAIVIQTRTETRERRSDRDWLGYRTVECDRLLLPNEPEPAASRKTSVWRAPENWRARSN